MANQTLDVAIVGGGVAGIYAAWRLAKDGKRTFRIFESTNRVGGRIMTIADPLLRFNANLGAMRFLDTQPLICALCDQFSARLGASYNHNFPTKFWVLRGRRVTFSNDSTNAPHRAESADGLYQVNDYEKRLEPASLVRYAISQTLRNLKISGKIHSDLQLAQCDPNDIEKQCVSSSEPGQLLTYGSFTPLDWMAISRYGEVDRTPLCSMSFWEIIRRGVSTEAMRLIRDGLGYLSIIGLWNAAEAIPWFLRDFDIAPEQIRSIDGGMEKLVDELRTDSHLDKHITYGSHLTHISHHNSSESPIELTFRGGESILAKRVILALPAMALRQLLTASGLSDPTSTHPIFKEPVTSYSLSKMFVWFNNTWWSDEIGSTGKVLSDLALRQLYFYAGKEDLHPKAKNSPIKGVMLAYTDETFASYWSAMAATFDGDQPWINPDLRKLAEDSTSDSRLNEISREFGVARRFWDCVLDHLSSIFPGKRDAIAKSAMFAAYRDWRVAPIHGGWHAWRAGVRAWEVRSKATSPFIGLPIHICGEALSAEQGWIEGALRSTERVLISELGLAAADFGQVHERVEKLGFKNIEYYVNY